MITGNSTHDVSIDRARGMVVKKFRSDGRGEPAREWAALHLLARHAPGLAPAPVRADLGAQPATIEMTWLPGAELTGPALAPAQTQALAAALDLLWSSVPSPQGYPATAPNPERMAAMVRNMAAARPGMGDDPAVTRAYAAATAWLDSGALHRPRASSIPIFGQGDPCLANFLWDGTRIRIIDFEDSGPSERAFELAILTEHISAWSEAGLDADRFVTLFDLTGAEAAEVHEFRRLAAMFWLILLRPGGPASTRNPPGTLQRQASRLLTLLS
jgi:Ser/Thr protein kinase RdoA (MazF antagonist)